MANALGKHWRLASVVLGIIVLLLVLYWLRTVVLPFAIGLVLAYLFAPAVSWLERVLPPHRKWRGFRRNLATLIAFIVLFGFVGSISYFVITAIIDASKLFLQHTPFYFTQGLYNIKDWFEGLLRQLSPEMQQEIEKNLVELGSVLGKSLRDVLMRGVSAAPSAVSTVIGFAALPFFLFYIMKDSAKLRSSFYSIFAPGVAGHIKDIVAIMENVLGRYVRAQLMLGLIVAYFSFIGLMLLDIPFAPALAILAGVTELIPTLGPWIGGGVAVIVTLAVSPEKFIWVAVLFLAIQLLENSFLVPRVQSAYLRIHPAVMIFLLVLGTYLAGFWGLLLAGPLTATAVEIYKYVRKVVQAGETDSRA